MDSSTHDYLFKVIVIGDKNVGKTSLLRRFCCKTFDKQVTSTIGFDFQIYDIVTVCNNQEIKVKLYLWDTSGEEKYRALSSVYYRNADCVLIVFDLSNEKSFRAVPQWLSDTYRYCDDPYQILVGNKCDLDSAVSYSEIEQLAYYNNLDWIETSAKDSVNIEETFNRLAKQLVEKREQLLSLGPIDNGPQSIFFDQKQADDSIYAGYCCSYV